MAVELEVDGKRVFAATGGRDPDPALPALIFLHGAGMDHTVWQLQARYFAHHGHGVLAIDLPGHGRSAGPPLDGIEALAGWTGGVMDAARLARATLVGHSMGALVALETAARLPDRVTAIALLGIAETMGVHPDLQAAAEKGEHLAYELVTSWGYSRRALLGGHPAPGVWMAGGALRLLERGCAGVIGHDLADCSVYVGAKQAATKVKCPVLILSGDRDRMTPAKTAAPLAGAIAGARMVTLPGAGHMMMLERPNETLDALREFIDGGAAA